MQPRGTRGPGLPQKSCQNPSHGGRGLRTMITPLFLRDPGGSPKSPLAEIALSYSAWHLWLQLLAGPVKSVSRLGPSRNGSVPPVPQPGLEGWACAPKPELLLRIILTTTFIVLHRLMGDAEIITQMAEGRGPLRKHGV